METIEKNQMEIFELKNTYKMKNTIISTAVKFSVLLALNKPHYPF